MTLTTVLWITNEYLIVGHSDIGRYLHATLQFPHETLAGVTGAVTVRFLQSQPRPQGFSLKKFKGKALGTRLCESLPVIP